MSAARINQVQVFLLAGLLALSALSCEESEVSDGGLDAALDALTDGEAGAQESGAPLPCSPAGWTVLQTGVSADLFGVWGASEKQVVVVGTSGTVLRFDGAHFRADNALPAGVEQITWRAVWGLGPQRIVAAGDRGQLLRYNGVGWRRETVPTAAQQADLLAVGGEQESFFVAGSESTLLRLDATGWIALDAPLSGLLLGGLAEVGQELLAVGGARSPVATAIVRFQNSRWREVTNVPQLSGQLLGVWGDDQGRALAVGRGGPNALPPVLRLEKGLWREEKPPGLSASDELMAVWGAGWEAVLVVGGDINAHGLVLRFNGQSWQKLELPTALPRLNALWGWPSGEVILVGDQGTALRYCDPSSSSQTPVDLGLADLPDLGQSDLALDR